jgi:hypothetical protein
MTLRGWGCVKFVNEQWEVEVEGGKRKRKGNSKRRRAYKHLFIFFSLGQGRANPIELLSAGVLCPNNENEILKDSLRKIFDAASVCKETEQDAQKGGLLHSPIRTTSLQSMTGISASIHTFPCLPPPPHFPFAPPSSWSPSLYSCAWSQNCIDHPRWSTEPFFPPLTSPPQLG